MRPLLVWVALANTVCSVLRTDAAALGTRLYHLRPHPRPALCACGVAMCSKAAETSSPREAVSPRVLTSRLTQAKSSMELLGISDENRESLNTMHMSAFWSRLGKLMRASARERAWLRNNAGELELMREQTKVLLPSFQARSLCNTAHGLASAGLRYQPPWDELWDEIIDVAIRDFSEFDPQNLANLIWAGATSGVTKPVLYDALAVALPSRLADFSPQGLTNLAWAFSRAEQRAPELYAAVAAQAQLKLSNFSTQGLSMTAWSFVTAGEPAHELLDAIEAELTQRVGEAAPQALAISAWTFATAGRPAPGLFRAIEREVIEREAVFNPQGLSNLVWAFATAGVGAPAMFDKVAGAAQSRLGSFKSQGLSNMAWAFGKARHGSPELFKAISLEMQGRAEELTPQEIANTCWGFATIGHKDAALFQAMSGPARERGDLFRPQEIANLLWAFSTLGHPSQELFEDLAPTIQQRLPEFSPQGLTNVAWAFAVSGAMPPSFSNALAGEVRRKLDQFNAQGIANAAWAFSSVGPPPGLFEMLLRESEERLEEFNPQGVAGVLWACANSGQVVPSFLERIAAHVKAHKSEYSPRELSITAWAYATIGFAAPGVFEAIAERAVECLDEFSPQGLTNMLWAFATIAYTPALFFNQLGEEVGRRLSELNEQELPNACWAFAVADVPCDALFGTDAFTEALDTFEWNEKQLSQLHQWNLWREELDAPWPPLSQELSVRCREAFGQAAVNPSRMQQQVFNVLTTLGLKAEQEVRIKQGYSIDLMVEWGGVRVAIEVDGPTHFLLESRTPSGSTFLKRRQLQRFGYTLLPVPYFEWEKLTNENPLRQRQLRCDYLAAALDEVTGMRMAARGDGWVVIDTGLLERFPNLLDDDDDDGSFVDLQSGPYAAAVLGRTGAEDNVMSRRKAALQAGLAPPVVEGDGASVPEKAVAADFIVEPEETEPELPEEPDVVD